jgi:D-aminopeptidase
MTQRTASMRVVISSSLLISAALLLMISSAPSLGQSKARARDLGIPFEGAVGTNNAITDVAGVEVGHMTLISGDGQLVVGKGPVRTGVTAILPRGKKSFDPVFAAWFPTKRSRSCKSLPGR